MAITQRQLPDGTWVTEENGCCRRCNGEPPEYMCTGIDCYGACPH